MNSLEFEALKVHIIERLQNGGAANAHTLASELTVPEGKVQLALEELCDEREKLVQRLPFGLWDINSQEERVA